jgi:cytosine/adenosine deaminase-related metal-dependent hydrolase
MIPVNKWWLGVVIVITLWACPSIGAQDRTIVLSGTVVTPKEILSKGWVVIKQGKIADVWKERPKEENAIWLDTDDIIFPGFIDLHNHPLYAVFGSWKGEPPYVNRYQWRHSELYGKEISKPAGELQSDEQSYCDLSEFAEVEALIGGTTSLSGFAPPRAPAPPFPVCLSQLALRKLDQNSGFYLTDPGHERVQNVLGVTPGDLSDAAANEVLRKLSGNELDLVLIHVAEGNAKDLESTLEFDLLKGRSLLGSKTAVIHGVAFGNREFRNMRVTATALVWSPFSNINLYKSTADVIGAFREGVLIALAPDWAPTGSRNMLGELQYAATYNRRDLGGFFSNQQLFEMATSIPARIAGIDDKVGSIQKGLFADLFLLRGDTRHPFDSLIQASSKDVELVLVNGVPIYGDPKLMNAFSVKTESLVICSEGKSLNLDVMTNGKLSDVQTRMIAKLAKYGRTLAKLDDCDK